MNFKDFFESDVKVTDRWPVNKAMYDMNDPDDRRRYEDDLRDRLSSMGRKVVSEELVREPHTITCWRGFDGRSFERDVSEQGGRIFIGGDRAMEGMLWFTHSLQPGHFHPMDYALAHAREGGHLLTYPLSCVRTYVKTSYDDGKEYQSVPEGMNADQTKLNRHAAIGGKFYELPEGWFFTWQVEKHIGFKGRLEIGESMLRRVS